MHIVVTGGREFFDSDTVERVLDELHAKTPITRLVEGGATGADMHAKAWARARAVEVVTYPADWRLGPSAGPVRNLEMLERERPDLLVAFPGGKGTASCTRLARERSITVLEVTETDMAHIGSQPNGPGKNKASGSQGAVGPSTKMNPCASNAGSGNARGGVRNCGKTGSAGAKPNVSGSKGCG